jgi:hypothetical protein
LRLLPGHGKPLGHFGFNLASGGEVLFGSLKAVELHAGPGKEGGQDNDSNKVLIAHNSSFRVIGNSNPELSPFFGHVAKGGERAGLSGNKAVNC